MSIEAVTVNHNSSLFAELMLRTLHRYNPGVDVNVTVVDNNSCDDSERQSLLRYAKESGVDFNTSKFTVEPEQPNSHGEVLREFVLTHPNCSHYLFLDPDIYFLRSGTIARLLEELAVEPDAFGIMPRCTWDGSTDHTPQPAVLDAKLRYYIQWPGFPWSSERESQMRESQMVPLVLQPRLHPHCALLENSRTLQDIAREVGFSVGCTFAPTGGFLWDTLGLATAIMRTHGLRHVVSQREMVFHFSAVSYDPRHLVEAKRDRCRSLLSVARQEPRGSADVEGASELTRAVEQPDEPDAE